MEWMSRMRVGLTAGLAVAVAVLGAVCSFAPQDPTFTNLRYPKDGIANWLGYPGALAGGSLVEAFGWAALLLPAAIAYWTLCPVGRPRGWRYAAQTAALLTLAAAWAGQWPPEPGLGLTSAGLIGWSGATWVCSTLGRGPGFALLTLGLALALWHQLYAPGLRSALKDWRAVGRLFTRAGQAEAQEWLRTRTAERRRRALARGEDGSLQGADSMEPAGSARPLRIFNTAVATAVLAPVQVLGALLLGAGLALHRWVVAPLVSMSLRNIQARIAPRPVPSRRPAARSEQAASPDAEACFGWLVDEPEPEARAAGPRLGQSPVARLRSPPTAGTPLDSVDPPPWTHPAEAPWHDADAVRPVPPPAPSGAQLLAEVSETAERLRRALARGANSSVQGASSSVQDADSTAREALGDEAPVLPSDPIAPPMARQPKLPPEEEGRERWERLLKRYRENLDLDWSEHRWRAEDELRPREDGTAKPRSPK